MPDMENLTAVRLDEENGELLILDQTLLPNEIKILRFRKTGEIREAIRSLRVRGAPAIGIAAGFGAYLAVRHSPAADCRGILRDFLLAKDALASARPTAVNLFHALDRMEKRLRSVLDTSPAEARAALLAEASAIRDEDEAMCRAIGEKGLPLLAPGMGVLTHCNAGRLAASRYGTALAPIYVGMERGIRFKVFADETRPLLQGARLTAFELMAAGADITLLCDNMAAAVMRRGWIQAVLVGCDRVAANGDVANKIGTSGLAVLARHYGIPFYVLGPTSTIDMDCPSGEDIVIEERNASEVTDLWYAKPMAPRGVGVFNPAFDVTAHDLVTAIVTQHGVAHQPFGPALAAMAAAPAGEG
ncbi:MAG: S-methyl-5-thioribose-1-phosphate isomerase [Planctomycetota bacterium]|jgi:methylthioribose-1-phosphate isomerase|nr:S-methyl-5-thioribose-1-phosphate isomerase [Planctomycetota bacterium]